MNKIDDNNNNNNYNNNNNNNNNNLEGSMSFCQVAFSDF